MNLFQEVLRFNFFLLIERINMDSESVHFLNSILKLSPDGLLDKLASHVSSHLGMHQSHRAGQRLLILVPHPQDTRALTAQAVGVILLLELGGHRHATHLLGHFLIIISTGFSRID